MTTWQNLVLGNQTGGVKRRTRRNAGKRLSQRRSHSKTRSTSKPRIRRSRRSRRSKRKRISRESNNRRNHGFIFSESNDALRNNIFY